MTKQDVIVGIERDGIDFFDRYPLSRYPKCLQRYIHGYRLALDLVADIREDPDILDQLGEI